MLLGLALIAGPMLVAVVDAANQPVFARAVDHVTGVQQPMPAGLAERLALLPSVLTVAEALPPLPSLMV